MEALCVLDTCALQVASSLSSTHAIVTCHRRMPSSHAIVTLPSSHAIVAPSLSSTHRCLIVVLYTCSSVCPGHMRSTGCHIVHADLATESVYTCMQHVYTRAHTHKKTHTHTHTQHTHITHTIQNTLCSRTLADNVQPLCVGRVSNGSGHIHRRSGVLELRRCWPWCVHYLKGWPEPYIYRYIRCTYGIFNREITIHTVIYGANVRFWPTLIIWVYLSLVLARTIYIHCV